MSKIMMSSSEVVVRKGDLMEVMRFQGVEKHYAMDKVTVKALRGVDLSVNKGEFLAISGPSGSGKTTLLNLVGCVDKPTSGRVIVTGKDTGALDDRALTRLRLEHLGFIFQSFNLIPVLDVFDNIEFPLLLQKRHTQAERRKKVCNLVDRVGLQDYLKHRPAELSGGQRQRVAVARALVTDPTLVLADEPTANLDSDNAQNIIRLMHELNKQNGTTFVFSTHDSRILQEARRIISLEDGRIVDDRENTLCS